MYTGATNNQQAIPAVEYLMSKDGGEAKRFVLLGTDYFYLRAFLKSKGVSDAEIMEEYTPFGHNDYQTIIAKIKKFSSEGKKTTMVSTINGDSNDPMEATYVGIHMWKQVVEKAKSTDVDEVIPAVAGQTFAAPSGYTLKMDDTNHHLWKPVFIREIKGDGQFNVVWKSKGPIRAQPWSPFIAANENKKDAPEGK